MRWSEWWAPIWLTAVTERPNAGAPASVSKLDRATFTMAKWVVRHDLRDGRVSDPLLCIDPKDMSGTDQAVHTVEECVQLLIRPDEICLGLADKRTIMRGTQVVGYIEIADAGH